MYQRRRELKTNKHRARTIPLSGIRSCFCFPLLRGETVKIKLIIAQLMFAMLLAVNVHGQDDIQKVRPRAKLYEPIIAAAAARYAVDPHLLWTIAYLESGFNSKAVSYKDGVPCAFGLMQFVSTTARRYGLRDPNNPSEAIDAAARYLRDLLDRFDARGDLVLAAYNTGEGTVEAYRDGRRKELPNGKVINPNAIRTGGIPPYAETREYVARGIRIYQNIADRQSLLPLNGSTVSKRQIESSIYVSNPRSGEQLPARSNATELKESPKSHSIYAN
jgi:hypothetical protein